MSDGSSPGEPQAVVVDLDQRRRQHAARPAVRLIRRAREAAERSQASREGDAEGAVVPLLRVGRALGRRPRRRRGRGRR